MKLKLKKEKKSNNRSRTQEKDNLKSAKTYRDPKERKARRKKRLTTTQRRIALGVCIVIAVISFTYVRNIISLSIENNKLRTQQEELKEERDRLKAKLKNVDNADYIEEQARKQLRLMNPDEILFVFEDEEGSDDAEDAD